MTSEPRTSNSTALFFACTLALAVSFGAVLGTAPRAAAQGTLTFELAEGENPFLCDGTRRELGKVKGFEPNEAFTVSWGDEKRTLSADADGVGQLYWHCSNNDPESWKLRISGTKTDDTLRYTLEKKEATEPPKDAPVGAVFDARSAPRIEDMAVWKQKSPFSGVGVYIPVASDYDNRSDKEQTELTKEWVSTMYDTGWTVLPIYAGLQAPEECATQSFETMSNDIATAREEGAAAAADAIAQLEKLGFNKKSPVYYNMEAHRPGCSDVVVAYLDAWTETLHKFDYSSGVYGSVTSTMSDLVGVYDEDWFDRPDAVWVSTFNGKPETEKIDVIDDDMWKGARINQYRLQVPRTYGGVTVEIDENFPDPSALETTPGKPAAGKNPDPEPTTDPEATAEATADPNEQPTTDPNAEPTADPNAEPTADPNAQATATPVTVDPDPTATPGLVNDSDGDGFDEPEPDNCDGIYNPDQADMDSDGHGDVCDRDVDGDGSFNTDDPAPYDPTIAAPPTAVPTQPPAQPAPTTPPTDNGTGTDDGTANESAGTLPTATATAPPTPAETPTEVPIDDIKIRTEDPSSNTLLVLGGLATSALVVAGGYMAIRHYQQGGGDSEIYMSEQDWQGYEAGDMPPEAGYGPYGPGPSDSGPPEWQ